MRSQPPPCHPGDRFYSFETRVHNGISTLESQSGDRFAILNKKTCSDVRALQAEGRIVRFRAFVGDKEWTRVIRAWTPHNPGSFSMDINIYGRSEYASSIGKILSSRQTFLQQPLCGVDGIRYYNPQFLHVGDLLGDIASETPSIRLDVPGTHTSAPIQIIGLEAQKEQQEHDDTREIDSILNSLSHGTILQRHTADRRIKSTLLPLVAPKPDPAPMLTISRHQEEAIDFIMQRETGSLPRQLSLWNQDGSSHRPLLDNSILIFYFAIAMLIDIPDFGTLSRGQRLSLQGMQAVELLRMTWA